MELYFAEDIRNILCYVIGIGCQEDVFCEGFAKLREGGRGYLLTRYVHKLCVDYLDDGGEILYVHVRPLCGVEC